MRPVRLELNGFASFRDPTVVDFTEADFFALVGPTGSGKSTILDAITFALYGTAYRWGRDNAVADALAPSANRCTVAFTFDVGNQRYQVAREVRRGGGAVKAVTQRNVSLVRFADATVVKPDPKGVQPAVLAGDIKELRVAIEKLLGLDFNEFCHCVVLPQGQFARFLTASGVERNQILLKLLGGTHYGQISRAANALAARSENAVAIYTQQLQAHADATPEAERATEARVARLVDLGGQVDDLVPQIRDAALKATAGHAVAAALRGDVEQLQALKAPGDVAELQTSVTAAMVAEAAARDAASRASAALTEATGALQSGPQRGPLELARDRHAEHAELTQRRGDLAAAAEAASQDAEGAAAHLATASAAEVEARAAATQADAAREAAQRTVEQLSATQSRLTAVRAPDGVRELADRAAAARLEAQRAAIRATQARQQHSDAEVAMRSAGEPRRLVDARDCLTELSRTRLSLDEASRTFDRARAAGQETARSEEEAVRSHSEADLLLEQARDSAIAAALRPHLRVGHECPVCTQTVTTLPPHLDDAALGTAQAALVHAEQALAESRSKVRQADSAVGEAERMVRTLTERAEQAEQRLAALIPGRPAGQDRNPDADGEWISQQEQSLQWLGQAAAELAVKRDEAEGLHAAAQATAESAAVEIAEATRALHVQVGSLTDLGVPDVDDSNLALAWQQLERWVGERTNRLVETQQEAAETLVQATRLSAEAQLTLKEAIGGCQQAHSARVDAVRAATTATAQRDNLLERVRALDDLLTHAPAAGEIPDLLAECSRLEAAVQQAGQAASSARDAAEAAQAECRSWDDRAKAARERLNRFRDELAPLKPPQIDLDNLTSAWETLTTWAAIEAATRAARAADEASQAHSHARQAVAALGTMHQLMADEGVDTITLPGSSTGTGTSGLSEVVRAASAATDLAPRLVASALADARAQKEAITRSLGEASKLRDHIETNREQQHVASKLADLTSSRKFQQWLADSARESLVTGASDTLLELSGGQFELSHRNGEFYVIDHSDADLTRSVRTLSGGETFQASLALALALSNHLVGMGGATKLESIFLDEGFGTLDAEALEVVAATLDQLSSGDRTVGIITHVSALAERIPVRFQVRRDSRSSTVVREAL